MAKVMIVLAPISLLLMSADESTPGTAKTICEAVKRPISENGTRLMFEGDFITDGYHGSKLIEEKCPEVFLHLRDGKDLVKDDHYDSFENLVDGDLTGPDLARVHVKIYGTLRLEDHQYIFYATKFIETVQKNDQP